MTMKLSPHQLIPINAKTIRMLDPYCCYSDDRLREVLGDDSYTALEVLTSRDGERAKVSNAHRLWVMYTNGIMTPKSQRLSAVDCGRRALQRVQDAGGHPHPNSWAACDAAERHAHGQATDQELQAAYKAAAAAAYWASDAAAWSAAWMAAGSAAAAEVMPSVIGARSHEAERARQVQWWVDFLRNEEAKS